MFQSSGADPRAVRVRLLEAGWDEVALAGVSDIPWSRLLVLLEHAVGKLN